MIADKTSRVYKVVINGVYTRKDDPRGPGREAFIYLRSFSLTSALDQIHAVILDPDAPACRDWLDFEGVSAIHLLSEDSPIEPVEINVTGDDHGDYNVCGDLQWQYEEPENARK